MQHNPVPKLLNWKQLLGGFKTLFTIMVPTMISNNRNLDQRNAFFAVIILMLSLTTIHLTSMVVRPCPERLPVALGGKWRHVPRWISRHPL